MSAVGGPKDYQRRRGDLAWAFQQQKQNSNDIMTLTMTMMRMKPIIIDLVLGFRSVGLHQAPF